MCLFFIESERSVLELEMTLVISVLALMIVGFFQFFSEGTVSRRLEFVGLIRDPNDLAAVIVMAIPFALVPVFGEEAHLIQQSGGLLFSGFSLLVIWFTRSRGALLALLTQVLASKVLKSSRGKWLRPVLLAGVLSVGYFITLKAIPRAEEDMEESQAGRITCWKAAINMTLHHPIWGVGFSQYPANNGQRAAHSSWLLAFAESGVMGGLLYVSFFLTVLRTAWRKRQRCPAQLYALVGYGVAMTFLSHTYLIFPYMLSGLIIASDSLKMRSIHEL
jgi:O-antigen ligase